MFFFFSCLLSFPIHILNLLTLLHLKREIIFFSPTCPSEYLADCTKEPLLLLLSLSCPLFTLILETSSQKKIDTKFQKGLLSLMELGDSQPPPSSLILCQIVGKQIGQQDYRPTKHPQRKANGCEPLSGNYVTTFWNFFRIN